MASQPSSPPRCSRCGGRLFLESETVGRRLHYFWECSVGCSRQFKLNGELMTRYVTGHQSVPVAPARELVLVEA